MESFRGGQAMGMNRREFIAASTIGLAALRLGDKNEGRLPLAFSTLACPRWELSKILAVAEANGFAAIELRGLLGEMNLPARPEFASGQLAQTKQQIAAHGLKIACVSSSTELHKIDPADRNSGLADAQRFIDLAAGLNAPYVRVFGNEIKGPKEEVIARVADGMHSLGEYAEPRKITVLIESHGDFVHSNILKEVLTRADSKHVGLLWDAHHTFADGHEAPEDTVKELGPWVRHTHLKDSVPAGKERQYVLTGKGDVPVERQIQALRHIHYSGLYCFEWEKVWHPDLQDPEIAIPDFARVASAYLQEAKNDPH
jgi:sugar phosphate isomerase/epimerase